MMISCVDQPVHTDVPLEKALANHARREQLCQLFNETPGAHPLLHPDALEAWFLSDPKTSTEIPIHDVRLRIIQHNHQIVCAGVLEPRRLKVLEIPRFTHIGWKLSGHRLYGKGLLQRRNAKYEASWFQQLASDSGNHSAIILEAVDCSDRLMSAVRSTGDAFRLFVPSTAQPRFRVQLPDSVDTYWTNQFRRKTRSDIRRRRRKLGNYQLTVATQPDEVAPFLGAAAEIAACSWQAQVIGIRISESIQEQEAMQCLARDNRFRGYLLTIDGRPIAFSTVTIHDGIARGEEMGFDRHQAHLSPGMVLMSEVVDDLIRHGNIRTLDFGLGDAEYKRRFSNDVSQSADVWLLSKTPRHLAAMSSVRLKQQVINRVKATLNSTGLYSRMRHLLREPPHRESGSSNPPPTNSRPDSRNPC